MPTRPQKFKPFILHLPVKLNSEVGRIPERYCIFHSGCQACHPFVIHNFNPSCQPVLENANRMTE